MKEQSKQTVDEYRLKIKKLKLKIEQEEAVHDQLQALRNKSKLFQQNRKAGYADPLQSALGRASFAATQRGLNMHDMFRAADKDLKGAIDTEEFIQIFRRLGIGMERQEEEALREAMGRECQWNDFKFLVESNRR